MAIPDDKERFTFVLEKSLKHKLQILADAEDMKLGAYVANILEEHIVDFEYKIYSEYGYGKFLDSYMSIFGDVHLPHISLSDNISPEEQKRQLIQHLKKVKDTYSSIKSQPE